MTTQTLGDSHRHKGTAADPEGQLWWLFLDMVLELSSTGRTLMTVPMEHVGKQLGRVDYKLIKSSDLTNHFF